MKIWFEANHSDVTQKRAMGLECFPLIRFHNEKYCSCIVGSVNGLTIIRDNARYIKFSTFEIRDACWCQVRAEPLILSQKLSYDIQSSGRLNFSHAESRYFNWQRYSGTVMALSYHPLCIQKEYLIQRTFEKFTSINYWNYFRLKIVPYMGSLYII